jgi:hypothetical protein
MPMNASSGGQVAVDIEIAFPGAKNDPGVL